MTPIQIGNTRFDSNARPLLIAGPCVIESRDDTLRLAEKIASLPLTDRFSFVFKASYMKDNRSSGKSYRGPGIDEGLKILQDVRETVGCPVLSDVHTAEEAVQASDALDIVQIPAFLCRQTSILEAAGKHARAVNIKKGQFLSADAMSLAADKVKNAGGENILLTERGTSFGHNDLVVDFRGVATMKTFGWPVIFDVTHSLQKPGGLGDRSGGQPELATVMARAAAAVPCDGLFIETHPDPKNAKSDAASMLPLQEFENLLESVLGVFEATRESKSPNG